MAATQICAETNVWDLCHHAVTQGFGIAGLGNAQFAEPDFEQQWITGTAIQHALAAARSCDTPAPPDTRLPVGPGFFWFRAADFSQLEAERIWGWRTAGLEMCCRSRANWWRRKQVCGVSGDQPTTGRVRPEQRGLATGIGGGAQQG